MRNDVYEILARVRQSQPVIHHLTNWVTIYDCAQIVKAVGGSPVMAHAPEEVADMTGIASALVLNIGTLTSEFIDAMILAATAANAKGIPVVLDACGAGATGFRDRKTRQILDRTKVDIIKGNASEIARVAGRKVTTKGVDATDVQGDLLEIAGNLASERDASVVITGKEDLVADAHGTYRVLNGHDLMTSVVGTGCMATSLVGTFAAVERDHAWAATAALSAYGIAAELAAEDNPGPATFKQRLIDELFRLDFDTIKKKSRISHK